ncbi:thiopeptide-type bacteriocin biosynthesis protein [Streptomyces jietaisiensis]|uniref:thiopeptide-type bacteriocin biosynthesis protein n=1 Tax=Streptomyces griseoaurantiacus TaxID=68213 RepID=UPI0032537C1A
MNTPENDLVDSSLWCQLNVRFPVWKNAETVVLTHLAPLLRAAEDDGMLTEWFIIRKSPCWRLRYVPAPGLPDRLGQDLDALITNQRITGWTEIIYEPETHAFGGPEAMACAHRLFHHDSRNLLDHLHGAHGEHRREISMLLCSLLMRSAGLDWYEQGDVWARVCTHRTPPPRIEQTSSDRLNAAVHRLITVNGEEMMRTGGPLADITGWARAYVEAGEDLKHLAESGQMHRGLRDVLAHHVLFAWNRIGLPYPTQTTLATTAKNIIFGPDPTTDGSAITHVDNP